MCVSWVCRAHAGLDVDAAMVAAAAAYVEEKNTLMACPGTEQGNTVSSSTVHGYTHY